LGFRTEKIDASMKLMPKQIDNYYQAIQRRELKEIERKKKKDELVAQAKEYYGFDIDPKDSRLI
jgi:hypothetical protein